MSEAMSERFRALAAEMAGKNAVDLANALSLTDLQLDDVSKLKAELESKKEFLRIRLAEVLQEEGLKNITLADGTRYRYQDEIFVSAKAEAKPTVIQVLKDSGNGGIIREDFNAATFKALVKELKPDEDGMPNPVMGDLLAAGMTLRVVSMARRY